MKKIPYTHRLVSVSESIRHNRLTALSAVMILFTLAASWQIAHRTPTSTDEPSPHYSVTTQNTSSIMQSNPLFTTRPLWVQDFANPSYKTLDDLYWTALEGPVKYSSNDERQYYTSDTSNLRIENGALKLVAHNEERGGYHYTSARIDTLGKQSFHYGRIDVMAKLPKGSGTWPAVWMLPEQDIYANKSPQDDPLRYRNGGEIDILEAIGSEPDVIYAVSHTRADSSRHSDGLGSYDTVKVPGSTTNYHKYSVFWTPTALTFAVDEVPFFTYSKERNADYTTWPFDQPFYLIVNLAMGGKWAGTDTRKFPGDGIDKGALPATLDVKSIYYYPLKSK